MSALEKSASRWRVNVRLQEFERVIPVNSRPICARRITPSLGVYKPLPFVGQETQNLQRP